jgi:hypothetical protein
MQRISAIGRFRPQADLDTASALPPIREAVKAAISTELDCAARQIRDPVQSCGASPRDLRSRWMF